MLAPPAIGPGRTILDLYHGVWIIVAEVAAPQLAVTILPGRPGDGFAHEALDAEALDHAAAKFRFALAVNGAWRDPRRLLDQPLRHLYTAPEPIALAGRPFHRRAIDSMKVIVHE